MTELELRQKYVKAFADLVGKCAEGSENHKALIATYNTLKPLPRGVKMLTSYDWCACTVTALAIRCGIDSIFAKECSCTKQIEQWKAKGRWVENDAYVPKIGDIIYFAWSDGANYKTTDYKADVDHVGVVEKVENGNIYAIEGNNGNNVNRRTIAVNGRYIRGFATPDYASLATKPKPVEKTAINMPTLQRGDESHVVRVAQRLLKEAGYHGNNNNVLATDKKFGADTERAVKKYQEINGLKVTGKIDGATWKMLLLGTK